MAALAEWLNPRGGLEPPGFRCGGLGGAGPLFGSGGGGGPCLGLAPGRLGGGGGGGPSGLEAPFKGFDLEGGAGGGGGGVVALNGGGGAAGASRNLPGGGFSGGFEAELIVKLVDKLEELADNLLAETPRFPDDGDWFIVALTGRDALPPLTI